MKARSWISILLVGAWVALLLGGLVLYLLWTDSQVRFDEVRDRQIEIHQTAHQALTQLHQRTTSLTEKQHHLQETVDQFLEELRLRYAGYETLLKERHAVDALIPDPRQYPIEEITFLLHLAQYRQTYLLDPAGALAALMRTQQILTGLDSVLYYPLIQQLEQAIAILQQYSEEPLRHAHQILVASWLVLSERITQLRSELDRQRPPEADGIWEPLWEILTLQFDRHIEVHHGAPRAEQTLSTYHHVLILYAVQTELFQARLALQAHRPEAYTQALIQARKLLAEPALQDQYPALKQDLESLPQQQPFPPAIDIDALLETLAQVR